MGFLFFYFDDKELVTNPRYTKNRPLYNFPMEMLDSTPGNTRTA